MPLKNTQLQTVCDTLLADLFNQIVTLQEKYRTEDLVENGIDGMGQPITRIYKRDKYFQLLETHSVIPADRVTKAADIGDKTPTDQKETYTNFGLVLPAQMPCSVSVSPYENDKGWGFLLIAKVIDGGINHQRIMNYGNEIGRDQDWTAI